MPPHPIQTTWDTDLTGGDPLGWPDYTPPDEETVVTGRTQHYAFVEGRFDVLGGSMGVAHGERVVRAYQRAIDDHLPMVVLSASGGARLQEGMVSLIQMARTAAAARGHAARGLMSVAIHRGPVTGGVLASYASLVDVAAARPGAIIGFAGPRVIELTTGTRLTENSHTAESAYQHGLIDALVLAEDEGAWIDVVLGIHGSVALPTTPDVNVQPDERAEGDGAEVEAADVEAADVQTADVQTAEVEAAEVQAAEVQAAWREVQQARSRHRFTGIQWADLLCAPWTELRGTDPTLHAAVATFAGSRVVVIAADRHARDGRHRPVGYRLAQRAIALAGRLNLPLLTFVDTPGADPGAASEADGLAREIAGTFAAMDALSTPSVGVCVGEGGSGGALALAYTDRLIMLEHAVFSVIAPEGAAAILERDLSKAPELAARLRLTSADLLDLGIIDGVVTEDTASLRAALVAALAGAKPGDRRQRFDRATSRWLR